METEKFLLPRVARSALQDGTRLRERQSAQNVQRGLIPASEGHRRVTNVHQIQFLPQVPRRAGLARYQERFQAGRAIVAPVALGIMHRPTVNAQNAPVSAGIESWG